MEHLKVLDLTSCKKLKCTPDFSNIPNLERLTLSRCTNLVELHGSIIRLKYLKYLNLNYCSSLSKLPDKIGFLKNLEQMYVHGCTGLKKFPNSIGKIKSLIALDLSAGKKDSVNMVISLTNLIQTKSMSSLDKDIDTWILSNFFDPSIMVRAKCVMKLLLDRHKALGRIPGKRFPDIFSNLKVLTKLDISYLLVGSLPESIGNLENLIELNAKRSLLESLPKSIGLLKNLQMLNLAGSHRLAELPIEIGGLSSLRTLNLLGASICLFPPTITKLSLLQSLNLAYCDNFGKAENGFFGLTSQQVKSSDKTQPANALKHFIAPLTGFGCFSQLKVLNLNCQNLECILVLPSSLQQLHLDEFNPRVKLPDVSNIKNLSYLSITFSEEQLKYKNLACLPESLRELRLFDAAALPDISNLKNLRKLVLHGCIYLKEILGLGKLESLEELDICKCQSLDSLANLSELRNLNYLSVIHCPKLSAIEGLDRLALVRKDVHFGNCECKECLSVERETTKRRRILRWVASRMGIPLPDFPLQVRHYTGRYQLVEDLEENYWSN